MGCNTIRAGIRAGFSALWFMPACTVEPSELVDFEEAAAPIDGGAGNDAGAAPEAAPFDAAARRDAGSDAGSDALEGGPMGESAADAGKDPPDASCEGAACPSFDPWAPFALDCANLPARGACQGGPHEVLLVSEERGLIAMFDAADGRFLGYFKRPGAAYTRDFAFATQGPDQCIWSVTVNSTAGVERWDTDGTFKDAPLQDHYVAVSDAPDELVVRTPSALAFAEDSVYVASRYGNPLPRIARFDLEGKFEEVVAEGAGDVGSMLVLGDRSLLLSRADAPGRVTRLASDGDETPVLGSLRGAGQVSYAGDGYVLVAETALGAPVHRVAIETGQALTVYPNTGSSSNQYGIAPLHDGRWLLTGGQFYVSALDPDSSNPEGQYEVKWDDKAPESKNFRQVGRACLSAEFLASRAPTPAQNGCVDPPEGPVVFEEDFEATGDFSGEGIERHYRAIYDRSATGFAASLEAAPGANPTRALKLSGSGRLPGNRLNKTGVYARFTAAQPSYVRYRLYVPMKMTQALGVLDVQNEALNTDQYTSVLGAYIYNGYVRGGNSGAATETGDFVGRWVTIEMRNIDWQARTYDLYVDCTRVTEAIYLPAGSGDRVDLLDLFNYADRPDDNTVAWVDDILIK